MRRFVGLGLACTALALGAGCGSSSHGPHSGSRSTAAGTTGSSIPPRGSNSVRVLSGSVSGAKASAVSFAGLQIHRPAVRASLQGLENLTLAQKLTTLSRQVAAFWTQAFKASGLAFPPSTVNIVDQTPAVCAAQQIITTDPPKYCPQDGSIDLPLAFMSAKVAPIGDAALALVVSDLFGYQVQNALGRLAPSAGLSTAEIEKTDSCLSGVYFLVLEAHHQLTAGDETAVNSLLADKSGPPGGTGVSAAELTAAFNAGIRSRLRASICLSQGGKVSAHALRSHTASSPNDFLATPAIATGWTPVHIGQWDFKVPPDHSYAATAANPSGIDITSTGGAHFGVGIVRGSPSLLSLDQIASFEFSSGSEDTPGTQAQITAIQGPSTGPAGSQDELIAWTGTRQDGTAVTGLVEIEDFGYGFVSYVLGGPSSSWASDLPILLAIKANTVWTPPAAS